jgi:hypothetical protein
MQFLRCEILPRFIYCLCLWCSINLCYNLCLSFEFTKIHNELQKDLSTKVSIVEVGVVSNSGFNCVLIYLTSGWM